MITTCSFCSVQFDKPRSHIARVKRVFCSRYCQTEASKTKIDKQCIVCNATFKVHPSMQNRYSTCSLECRRKNRSEEKNPNWRGGELVAKKQFRKKAMYQLEYKQWRLAVFERDDYTCQFCHKRGGTLEADHIMPWSTHEHLRYEVSNGRTLCQKCHRTTFKNLKNIKDTLCSTSMER